VVELIFKDEEGCFQEVFVMIRMAELKEAVSSLEEKDLREFSRWFAAYEGERWDAQLLKDQDSDPLKKMMEAASQSFAKNQCKPL
jgi:hypothetical protein